MPSIIPPLALNHLTKSYGQNRGVSDVSFSLKPGEVFGFLGPNGAGKTTTIRTILNFMQPTSGTISLFGLDSVKNSIEIKRRVGYLAGDLSLYGNLTGQQLLTYLGSLQGNVNKAEIDELIRHYQADLKRPLRQLSKGNQQKIGLIQAFMHKPELLILDEPTSGLDPLMQERFYESVLRAKMNGATILISSHNLNEVQRICDRAAFIRQGQLVSIEDITRLEDLAVTTLKVTFASTIEPKVFSQIRGVEQVEGLNNEVTFLVRGSIDKLVKALAKHTVISLHVAETSLEEMFMRQYQDDGAVGK